MEREERGTLCCAQALGAESDRGSGAGKRFVWLDVAKGFGILWVVAYHADVSISMAVQADVPFRYNWWSDAVGTVTRLASQSLTIFIAVSGFVLTYAALRRANSAVPAAFPKWLVKRLIQLLPIYWFAHLMMYVAYWVAGHPKAYAGMGFWAASFFCVNGWIPGWFGGVAGSWWFMSLILQVSILYPFLARALHRLPTGWFLALAWIATLASRLLCAGYLYEWNPYLQFGVFSGCRLFEFALGMAAAKWFFGRKTAVRPLRMALLGTAALAGYLLTTFRHQWTGPYVVMPTIASASICVLTWFSARAVSRIKYASSILSWCGTMTFPVFLVHGLKSDEQIGILVRCGIDIRGMVILVLVATGVAQGFAFRTLYLTFSKALKYVSCRVRAAVFHADGVQASRRL